MKFYLTSQKYANSNPNLTAYEIDQIHKAYLEKLCTVCTVSVWMPLKFKNTRNTGTAKYHSGSIIISDADLLDLQTFKKLLGKPYFIASTNGTRNYPKLVIKDL